MIPKIIHYCWFGRGAKPPAVLRCIESWRRACPGYEIREWNEDNCDYLAVPFAAEAYRAKKYAFVSDVMRLAVLEQHGGIYFDTDVELLRCLDPLLEDEGFIGFEDDRYVNSGQGMAAVAHHPVVQAMLEVYRGMSFGPDGSTAGIGCPLLNTRALQRFGLVCNGQQQLVCGIRVYPADRFDPLDSTTGVVHLTEHTYSIHHYSMSWLPKKKKLRVRIGRLYRRVRARLCKA